LISEYRTIYKPLAEAETIPMAGARETLSRLREAGVTVAVATYKRIDLAMALLGATGLTPLLDVCRGRVSDEDRRDKTAILLKVLEETSPHRGEPLYVGDHEEDRKAAEALGVDFLPYVGPESWDELARVVRVN